MASCDRGSAARIISSIFDQVTRRALLEAQRPECRRTGFESRAMASWRRLHSVTLSPVEMTFPGSSMTLVEPTLLTSSESSERTLDSMCSASLERQIGVEGKTQGVHPHQRTSSNIG